MKAKTLMWIQIGCFLTLGALNLYSSINERNQIKKYNKLVDEYNDLLAKHKELYKSRSAESINFEMMDMILEDMNREIDLIRALCEAHGVDVTTETDNPLVKRMEHLRAGLAKFSTDKLLIVGSRSAA